MAEYSTSFERSGGYSFDQQAITDLWKQTRAHTGKDAEISVALEGSHSIRASAIDELFDDAFVKNNYIERVSITSHDYGQTPSRTISIVLRQGTFTDAISVSITGERANCSARLAEVTSIVDGRRLWYSQSRLASGHLSQIILVLISIALGIYGVHLLEIYTGEAPSSLFASVFVSLLYVVISVAIWPFKRLMFPNIVFEIGKSANIGVRAAYWRNLIGVGIILALVVGVFGGIIVERMK